MGEKLGGRVPQHPIPTPSFTLRFSPETVLAVGRLETVSHRQR